LQALSENERFYLGVDLADLRTYYFMPKDKRFVRHIDEEGFESGFSAKFKNAQFKQWMPYMPTKITDKMDQ
jgi:hypothetical protein